MKAKRWTDVALSFVMVRLTLWLTLAVYVAPGWLTGPFNLLEYMDDHQHHGLDVVGRTAYLTYHQFPVWNPWWCGGIPGMAEPETIYLAPDFLVRAILFGVERGRHIVLVTMLVIGLEGVYRLARKHEASAVGAAFAAAIYCTNFPVLGFVHDGAFNFLTGFELMPWALLCLYEGLDSVPWRLFGGFIVAWIFLCAGTYPTPYTLLLLGLNAIAISGSAFLSGRRGEWLRPWKALVTMGAVSFLLAVPKMVPMLLFLRQHPRTWLEIETHSAQQLFSDLITHYPWVFVLAFVGLVFADRAAALFVGFASLTFVLAMGDFDNLAPYHMLRKLPLLGQLRNPERYLVPTILFLSLAAARGVTRVEDLIPGFARRAFRNERVPSIVHGAFVLAGTLAVAVPLYPRTKAMLTELQVPAGSLFTFDAPRPATQPFRQARGNRRDVHVFNYLHQGSLQCITGTGVQQSPALRADLPAEEYPLDPTKATVRRVRWTPNRIDLEVDAHEPTTIIVNQNWNEHFRVSVGRVVSHDGLLAVEVPAGKHELRIAYVDRVFDVGIVVAGLTLLALAVYTVWYWSRRVVHEVRRFDRLPWLPPESASSD